MAKKPPFARGRRVCIFCGGTRISKEHVYADWLAPFVNKNSVNHEESDIFFPRPGFPEHTTKIRKRSGDARSRRLKIACIPCNSGWMSRLQTNAKPILIPLFKGSPHILSPGTQSIVAAWATMTVMVGEHLKDHSLIASQAERDQLRLTQTPPATWQLWIASLAPGFHPGWVSSRFPMGETEAEYVSHPHDDGVPRPNVQETTFSVGRVLIRAVSSPFPDMFQVRQFTAEDERFLIIPIWPQRPDEIVWPPPSVMSKNQWITAASRLFELISRSARRG